MVLPPPAALRGDQARSRTQAGLGTDCCHSACMQATPSAAPAWPRTSAAGAARSAPAAASPYSPRQALRPLHPWGPLHPAVVGWVPSSRSCHSVQPQCSPPIATTVPTGLVPEVGDAQASCLTCKCKSPATQASRDVLAKAEGGCMRTALSQSDLDCAVQLACSH